MVRVAILAIVACLLAACSLGPRSLGFGFNGGIGSSPEPALSGGIAGTAPKTATPKRSVTDKSYRTSALDTSNSDRSYRKAPPGALADRDYGAAKLDSTEAVAMVNAYRKQNGLRALQLEPLLTQAAKGHSRDLSKWDRISHYGSDGSNPWDRVKRTGYKARLAAENVGTGQATLAEVFKGWQQSPGHNKNLLLPEATQMGIALVYDPKTEFKTFWTLVIGTPM